MRQEPRDGFLSRPGPSTRLSPRLSNGSVEVPLDNLGLTRILGPGLDRKPSRGSCVTSSMNEAAYGLEVIFALGKTQNLLRGTCSGNGLGENQGKNLLQPEQIFASSSKSLDLCYTLIKITFKMYGEANALF